MRFAIALLALLVLVSGTAYAALPLGLDIPDRPLTLEEKLWIEDLKANNRWLIPKSTGMSRIVLEGAGCRITGDLDGPYKAYSVKCPNNVHISGAIEDELLKLFDIPSAKQINADDVWNLGYRGTGQVVAVIDSGIDTNHPALKNDIAGGKNFLVSPINNDISETTNAHGTMVAGIITSDDVVGTGIAPRAKVWIGKVCNSLKVCLTSDVIDAIEYIVKGPDGTPNTGDEPAKIISISLGSDIVYTSTCDSILLSQWVNWAADNGAVVTVASGNNPNGISSPACASKAIAVGEVKSNDIVTGTSGRGAELDIVAPGYEIWTTIPVGQGSYNYSYGTSFAAPHVSAAIAMLHEFEPLLKTTVHASKVKDALYKGAEDYGRGWTSAYGWGRIDANASLYLLHDITVTSFTGPSPVEKSVSFYVDARFVNQGLFAETFTYTINDLTDGVVLKSGSLTIVAGGNTLAHLLVTLSESASPGWHTLEIKAAPAARELDKIDNSRKMSVEALPSHDIAATGFSVPASAVKGTSFSASITFENQGDQSETFTYVIRDRTDNVELQRSQLTVSRRSSSTVTRTLTFSGSASTGVHTLEVEVLPVTGEKDVADNKRTSAINVQSPSTTHDMAVTSFSAPSSATKGTVFTVSIGLSNEGSFSESFTYVIRDKTDNREMYRSPAITVGSGQSTTASRPLVFDSTASTGMHTLEAEALPVSGETDTADNRKIASINVQSGGTIVHDVAVYAFSLPSSVAKGQGFIADITFENQGTEGESFTYTIKDLTDNVVMNQNAISLQAGAQTRITPTISFGIDATTGTHNVEVRITPVSGETDTVDNVRTTQVSVQSGGTSSHDLAVTSFTGPSSAAIGSQFFVDYRIKNEGTFTESFTYVIKDITDNVEMLRETLTLNPSAELTVSRGLTFGSSASLGIHTWELHVFPVTGEIDTADNTRRITIDVLSNPSAHDIAATSFTAPSSATKGTPFYVTLSIHNEGSFAETFTYIIRDKTDSVEMYRETRTLNPSTGFSKGASLTFGSSASTGIHTLELEALPVPGETDTADNKRTQVVDVQSGGGGGSTHDIAVTSFTVPSSAAKGQNFDVKVEIANEGDFGETVTYAIKDMTDNIVMFQKTIYIPSKGLAFEVPSLVFGSSASTGIHTLELRVTPVPGETDTADNVKTATINVQSGLVHDIAVESVLVDANIGRLGVFGLSAVFKNEGDSSETFAYAIKDITANRIMFQRTLTLEAGSRADESPTLTFGSSAAIGTHAIEVRVSPIAGETDTADNAKTASTNVGAGGTPVSREHDISPLGIAAPSTMIKGTTYNVDVTFINYGSTTETFNYTVYDLINPSNVRYSGTETLPGGQATKTVRIRFTYPISTYTGLHHIKVGVSKVPGETLVGNNVGGIDDVNVADPPNTVHDIAAVSFTGPPSVTKASLFDVSINIKNEGTSGDLITYVIKDLTDGVEMLRSSIVLGPGVSLNGPITGLAFASSASTSVHVLELRVLPVGGETDLADNSKTMSINVMDAVVHDVSVDSLAITPSPVVRGQPTKLAITVSNKGSVSETFAIRIKDVTANLATTTSAVTLIQGETKTINLWATAAITSGLAAGTHEVFAQIDPLAGETNTANNKKTVFVNVV